MLSKFKKLAVAASVLTLGMAFNATAKPVSVGMSFQELNNEYFVTMKEALESATGEMGAQLYIADAAHDVSKQTSDIEDMLQKKIDILLINPADSVGAETAVLAAKKPVLWLSLLMRKLMVPSIHSSALKTMKRV